MVKSDRFDLKNGQKWSKVVDLTLKMVKSDRFDLKNGQEWSKVVDLTLKMVKSTTFNHHEIVSPK